MTELEIKNATPPTSGQVMLWDKQLTGFGVRISQGGTKTFIVMYGKTRKRRTIGRYPVLSLQQARAEAKKLLATVTLQKHYNTIFFDDAMNDYIDKHLIPNTRASTQRSAARLLRLHFHPVLRSTTLQDITPLQVSRIIEGMSHTPSEAKHALTVLKSCLKWNMKRGYPVDPLLFVQNSPQTNGSREKVLEYPEIEAILSYANSEAHTFNRLILFLLYTGQRRGESSLLRWQHIDLNSRTINFPRELTKNNRPHTIPLTPTVQHFLGEPKEPHVLLFPSMDNPSLSMSGWSKLKARFDRGCKLTDWTLHDLRRTVATRLGDFDVPPHVIEAILNHVSGTKAGVAGIYQRNKYAAQVQEALTEWDRRLTALTRPWTPLIV